MNIVDKRDSKAHSKLSNKLDSINEVTLTGVMSLQHTRQPACEIRPGPLVSIELVDSSNSFCCHGKSPRPSLGAFLLAKQQEATKRFQKVSQNTRLVSMLDGHESVNFLNLNTCQNR